MKNIKKRNVVVSRFDDNGEIRGTSKRVSLMNRFEAYDYAKNIEERWCVELFSSKVHGLEILKDDGRLDGSWFYDDGCNVITLALDISDDYYLLAEDRFSKSILSKVWSCYKGLLLKGYSVRDIFYFKRINNRYHFMRNDIVFESLDSKLNNMLNDVLISVFKEKNVYYEIIIFPTKSEEFFFENTLVAYNTMKDFNRACESWGISK